MKKSALLVAFAAAGLTAQASAATFTYDLVGSLGGVESTITSNNDPGVWSANYWNPTDANGDPVGNDIGDEALIANTAGPQFVGTLVIDDAGTVTMDLFFPGTNARRSEDIPFFGGAYTYSVTNWANGGIDWDVTFAGGTISGSQEAMVVPPPNPPFGSPELGDLASASFASGGSTCVGIANICNALPPNGVTFGWTDPLEQTSQDLGGGLLLYTNHLATLLVADIGGGPSGANGDTDINIIGAAGDAVLVGSGNYVNVEPGFLYTPGSDVPTAGSATTGTYSFNAFLAAPIPVPAAVWLFGSALGLLGWVRRRA